MYCIGEAHRVGVLVRALCKIGYSLDAAVRMEREARRIGIGVGAVEGIEHKEGIEGFCSLCSEHAHEAHACAVLGAIAFHDIRSVAVHRGFQSLKELLLRYLFGRDIPC